jgi:hypothetical protein
MAGLVAAKLCEHRSVVKDFAHRTTVLKVTYLPFRSRLKPFLHIPARLAAASKMRFVPRRERPYSGAASRLRAQRVWLSNAHL